MMRLEILASTGVLAIAIAVAGVSPSPAPYVPTEEECCKPAHEAPPAGCNFKCKPGTKTCNGSGRGSAVAGDCKPGDGECGMSGTTPITLHNWECRHRDCDPGEDGCEWKDVSTTILAPVVEDCSGDPCPCPET